MSINVTFLRDCIGTLEVALEHLDSSGRDSIQYKIARAACVKEFELILEQSGRLLRRRLADFFSSYSEVDGLSFKDTFRRAAKHCLLDIEAVDRWHVYRDHRNNTAHNYGESFAEATLKLLPGFILDAKALADINEAGDG